MASMGHEEVDTNVNSPAPGALRGTTYFVYVDDSGDENQDLLTALAIPVPLWTETLQKWKKMRRWVNKKYGVLSAEELHALDLGSNSRASSRPLAGLSPEARNKISKAALNTLRSVEQLRVLTVYKAVPEGSGSLYEPLVKFIHEFCEFHDSYASIWYDGTAESLKVITRRAHRALPYEERRVLEDPTGYSSGESHLIQMVDLVAYAAHNAVLNDLGTGRRDTYLREHGYTWLLPSKEHGGLVWPGHKDTDGFPAFGHPLGIRGYP